MRISLLIGLLAIFLRAAPLGAQSLFQPDSSLASLGAGWDWAQSQIAENESAWIVWEFTTILDEKVVLDNRFGHWHFNHHGLSLDAMLYGNTRAQLPYARERRILIKALLERGRLSQIEAGSREKPVAWKHPIYWLGPVSSEQSFRHLSTLLEPQLPRWTAWGIIDALGLHDHPERTNLLNSFFNSDDWVSLRPHLLASLAHRQAPQVEALLLELSADSEEDKTVREVAIAALGRYASEAALARVLSLATDEAQPLPLREQAIEAMVWFEAASVSTTLNRLAWFDANEDVRETAVESLAALSMQERNTLLLDIARNHPSAETRNEAMVQLQSLLF